MMQLARDNMRDYHKNCTSCQSYSSFLNMAKCIKIDRCSVTAKSQSLIACYFIISVPARLLPLVIVVVSHSGNQKFHPTLR